jgi:hypothetical protein
MTDEDDDQITLQPGQLAPEIAADAQSIIDRIKQRRDAREDELTIDIPSWGGDLQARYQVLDRNEIDKMVKRIRARQSGNGSSGTDADADFLIKACVGVTAVDQENDIEEPLTPGYTMDLARLLDPKYPRGHPQEGQPVDIKIERHLVVYLFGFNNIAMAAHAAKIARWMQDTSRPVEDPQ